MLGEGRWWLSKDGKKGRRELSSVESQQNVLSEHSIKTLPWGGWQRAQAEPGAAVSCHGEAKVLSHFFFPDFSETGGPRRVVGTEAA